MRKEKFLWKPFLSSLFILALPVALQNLLTSTATMIDTIMVGRLGEVNVAALGLCGQFSTLFVNCYWGFVGGGILFFSQYWGSRDDEGIERSYGLTLLCMMSVAIIFSILSIFFPHLVLSMYTNSEEVINVGVKYLRIVGFSYILQVFSLCLSTVLRSIERVKIPLYASICSVCVNIIFNTLLIFGYLGFPSLGIKGAAIATLISSVVNVLVILIISKKKGIKYIFHFKNHFKWGKGFVKLYFSRSYPMLLNEIFLGVGNLLIGIVLGHQNDSIIASVAVFRTIEGLVIAFFSGFSSASSVLVGKEVGSGESEVAYERAKRIIYTCQIVIAIAAVVISLFSRDICLLMGLKEESAGIGSKMLIIYSLFAIIRMGNWAQNDTFRASGDTITGTVLEITFMFLLVIPLVYLGNFLFHLPFLVVFAFCYSDEIIRYIIMQFHLYSGKWIKPVTEEGKKGKEEFMKKLNSNKKAFKKK